MAKQNEKLGIIAFDKNFNKMSILYQSVQKMIESGEIDKIAFPIKKNYSQFASFVNTRNKPKLPMKFVFVPKYQGKPNFTVDNDSSVGDMRNDQRDFAKEMPDFNQFRAQVNAHVEAASKVILYASNENATKKDFSLKIIIEKSQNQFHKPITINTINHTLKQKPSNTIPKKSNNHQHTR